MINYFARPTEWQKNRKTIHIFLKMMILIQKNVIQGKI